MDAKAIADLGVSAAVIVALFGLVYFMFKEHKTERVEWLAAYKENTEVLRSLGSKCGIKPLQ